MNSFQNKKYTFSKKYLLEKLNSLEELKKNLEENSFANADNLDFLSNELIEKNIGNAEKIALSLRANLELLSLENQKDERDFNADCYKNLPVSVQFDNGILIARMPLTFKRSTNEKANLARYMAVCIKKYCTENHIDLYNSLSSPVHEAVIRKSFVFKRNTISDNDKNEFLSVANELFIQLGLSDSARNMSYSSFYHECDKGEEGVEVLLFSESKMIDLLPEMCTKLKS